MRAAAFQPEGTTLPISPNASVRCAQESRMVGEVLCFVYFQRRAPCGKFMGGRTVGAERGTGFSGL
eukprot:scaffold204181_cov37-Tisochrysis_lutea.AAC.3